MQVPPTLLIFVMVQQILSSTTFIWDFPSLCASRYPLHCLHPGIPDNYLFLVYPAMHTCRYHPLLLVFGLPNTAYIQVSPLLHACSYTQLLHVCRFPSPIFVFGYTWHTVHAGIPHHHNCRYRKHCMSAGLPKNYIHIVTIFVLQSKCFKEIPLVKIGKNGCLNLIKHTSNARGCIHKRYSQP